VRTGGLCFLLCGALLGWAQGLWAADIQLTKVREMRSSEVGMPQIADRYLVYANGNKLVSVDVASGQRRDATFGRGIGNVLPPQGSRVIVAYSLEQDGRPLPYGGLSRYDASTGSVGLLSGRHGSLYSSLLHYQGNTLFGLHVKTEAGEGAVVAVDTSGQLVRRVTIPGADNNLLNLMAISPDKRLLLVIGVVSGTKTGFLTFDIESASPVGTGGAWGVSGFLSNAVVYRKEEQLLRFHLYDVRGSFLETINLQVGEQHDKSFYRISPELQYLVLRNARQYDEDYYFYELKPLREYLEDRNYRFRGTAGEVNASGVRVRQNPNLQTEALGELTRGDALEVLDRTGTKVRIGDQEAWWYKVRRKADGLEGWSYGAYIDVESEQPEPAPASALSR
jgi:hypothetical protein